MRRLITDAQAKFRKMVEDQRVVGGSQPPQAEGVESTPTPAPSSQDGATPKASLDAEKGEPPPPPISTSSSSQPPPPPPRERKIPPVPTAVTSSASSPSNVAAPSSMASGVTSSSSITAVTSSSVASTASMASAVTSSSGVTAPSSDVTSSLENGADSVQQLVRPPSPAPGPSNKADTSVVLASSPVASTSSCQVAEPSSTSTSSTSSKQQLSLRLDNDRLKREVAELRRLLSAQVGGASSSAQMGGANGMEGMTDADKVLTLQNELAQARDALAASKSDRKRLKAEKFDLLNQMKQLYATLEDKEKELRDFIRSFEQERCERERERWSLLRHARDEAERSLNLAAQLDIKDQQLIEARRQLSSACLSDGGGDNISLCRTSLNGGGSRGGGGAGGEGANAPPPAHTPTSSNLMIGGGGGDRGSCSADSGVRGSSDRESGATSATGGNLSDSTTDGAPTLNYESSHHHLHANLTDTNCTNKNCTNIVEQDTISLMSSIATGASYQLTTPKDCNSPSLSPLNAHPFSRSLENSNLSRSVEQLTSPPPSFDQLLDDRVVPPNHRRSKERLSSRSCGLPRGTGGGSGPWGSISRVFARSRHRSKVPSPSSHDDALSACGDPTYASVGGGGARSWSPLTEEGYAEKLRLLREAGQVPMERWRAPTVLAWLEIALGMPQYGPRCAENVKSGKVLLELSDVELECGLGISHPMHRKKLRLAIEEHRQPGLVRYPPIAQLGHTWVSSEWLPDLGLAQYSENFAANMVDARMLDNLSKKELEKFLGVTRKFHQASIVHGIHLLRMMKYDRQALAVRRHQCETIDADPLVWTNQRFIRWARNIDLGEYADNLKDSGVHGALVVLEPSLNGDTMATALGIPPSRHMIRRHLTTELEALVLPARSSFERLARERRRTERLVSGGGSLGRSFSRSYGALSHASAHSSPRSSVVLEGGAESFPTTPLPPLQGGADIMQAGDIMQHHHHQSHHHSNGGGEKEKDKRRASLRTYSMLYLKKFSSWKNSQSSLGRVLGLKSSSSASSSSHHNHHHHHSSSSLRVSDPCPLPSSYYPSSPSSSHQPPLPPNDYFPSSPSSQPPLPNHYYFPSSPQHPPPLPPPNPHHHTRGHHSPTYSSPAQFNAGLNNLSLSASSTTLSSSSDGAVTSSLGGNGVSSPASVAGAGGNGVSSSVNATVSSAHFGASSAGVTSSAATKQRRPHRHRQVKSIGDINVATPI